MAKVDATRSYGAEVVLVGEGFDEANSAATEQVEAGRDARPRVRGRGRHRGAGTPRARARGAGRGNRDARRSGRRRRARVRDRDRAEGASARGQDRRRPGRLRSVHRRGAGGHDHRRRDRRQAAGRADDADPRDRLDDLVVVSDREIAQAIVLLLERVKLVVEGAGAASVAAVLAGKIAARGRSWRFSRAATSTRRSSSRSLVTAHASASVPRHRTKIDDRPGALSRLLALIADERVNVVAVEHHREGMDLPVTGTEVELTLAMRDEEHCDELSVGSPTGVTRLSG